MNAPITPLPPDPSLRNRQSIRAAKQCGCFHCLAVFPPDAISEWIDGGATALCPRCGVDAVLPDTIDYAALQTLQREWFGLPDRSAG